MAATAPATGSMATASSVSKRPPARRSGTTSSCITDCGITTPPAAPNLIDITVGGKPIKAVAQVTKQAFVYVFDRVTGQPVWPIEEQPVPASSVPGESASKTQPFPTQAGADRHSGRARRRSDRFHAGAPQGGDGHRREIRSRSAVHPAVASAAPSRCPASPAAATGPGPRSIRKPACSMSAPIACRSLVTVRKPEPGESRYDFIGDSAICRDRAVCRCSSRHSAACSPST